LEAGVAGQVFPGATSCVAYREAGETVYALSAGGRLRSGGAAVAEDTKYDLASLTKPFVAVAALRLAEQGVVELDARADSVLADVRGGQGGVATLEQLLSHRSGLAPWGGLYLDVPHEPGTSAARRWILSEASRRVEKPPNTETAYSDLGYIIAGDVLARAAGAPLEKVVEREVTVPLGIDAEVFFAGVLPAERKAELMRRAAPTERCDWRGRIVVGEVHDENSFALGGVSGHAGLFGTSHGVAVFGNAMLDVLDGTSTLLNAKSLEQALEKRDEVGRYRMGWDTKSGTPSSAGRHLGPRTFGHLGFTGTSIWIDPDARVVVVLLTNRVHPSRANEKIKGFRPAFHDGVVAAWDEG
jgi:CubicO group peptidase (beta-lactamase class C family)